jgi:hypothetical protein
LKSVPRRPEAGEIDPPEKNPQKFSQNVKKRKCRKM